MYQSLEDMRRDPDAPRHRSAVVYGELDRVDVEE
jgi:hypothetical protein